MAEWYRLNYVVARRPRTLRQSDHGASKKEHRQSQREDYPVHADGRFVNNPIERRSATTRWLNFLTIRSIAIKEN
jgi:hypothetical protein